MRGARRGVSRRRIRGRRYTRTSTYPCDRRSGERPYETEGWESLFLLEPDEVCLGEATEIAGDVDIGIEVVVIHEERLEFGDFTIFGCIAIASF